MRHLLVGVLMIAATGCRPNVVYKESPAASDSAKEQPGELTKEEAAFLQGVCEEGISTTMEGGHYGPLPHREVAVKTAVEELHKKNRLATLRFLLRVVKEGTAQQALAAGVTALALEEGPVYPLSLWDLGSDTFDEPRADGLPTRRERLVKKLKETLAGAEAGRKLEQGR